MCKVSIIVPIYNTSKYLRQCLDSIINQSLDDIEIILVNDGSKDNSLEICREYKCKDKRIRIIDKPNGGLSSAKNIGIEVSKGQYFGFVDSDDYISTDMYSNLVKYAEEYDADLVCCDNYTINCTLDSECIFEDGNKYDDIKLYDLKNAQDKLELAKLIPVASCASWNKLYKRDVFKTLRFPYGKKFEDAFVFIDLFFCTKKVLFIPDKLYYYRFNREGSIINKKTKSKSIDYEHIDILCKYIEDYSFFIKDLNIEKNYIVRHYKRFYNQFDAASVDNKYIDEMDYLRKKLYQNIDKKIKLRYKLEIYLIYYWPKLYSKLGSVFRWRKL